MVFVVNTPLAKMGVAVCERTIERVKSKGCSLKEAEALRRFVNAMNKHMSTMLMARLNNHKGTTVPSRERVARCWGDLPLFLQHEVAKAATENNCVSELEAIVGALPPTMRHHKNDRSRCSEQQ